MEKYSFPAGVGISPFIVIVIKVLFPLCTLTWRVNNYVSRQGRGKDGTNKSTVIIIIVAMDAFVTQLTVFD